MIRKAKTQRVLAARSVSCRPMRLSWYRLVLTVSASLILSSGVRAADVPATTPASRAVALKPGDHKRLLKHDGWDRSYLVHVPPGHDPARPTPVVLAFHGAMMNAAGMNLFSGLNKKSDEAKFVVVYPNGTGIGEAILFSTLVPNRQESPARGRLMMSGLPRPFWTTLPRWSGSTRNSVFATGMSNGGMMSHRLAAELSDRIAAIAPVAGTLAVSEVKPGRPVPVMHFHGKADAIVPYGGPRGRVPPTMQFKGVDETIATWIRVNGCPAEPKVTQVADNAGDGMPGTIKTFGPGKAGSEVVLVVVDNAGHTWPGREPIVGFIGKSGKNVIANDLMWEFFQRHPMR